MAYCTNILAFDLVNHEGIAYRYDIIVLYIGRRIVFVADEAIAVPSTSHCATKAGVSNVYYYTGCDQSR